MPTPLLHYTEHGSGPPLVLVHGVMISCPTLVVDA
jgi:hypothetical protein